MLHKQASEKILYYNIEESLFLWYDRY